MKVKIKRKSLKEAEDPTWPPKNPKAEETWRKGPKAEPTLSPIGKPEDGTKKFPADDGAIAFQTRNVRANVAQQADITAKESPEDIKRALSKVIEEPGLLEKVFGWVQKTFFPPSLEVPEIEAEKETPKPMRKPDLSKAISYADKFGLGIPDAASVPLEEPGLMPDPDPYGRKARLKESVDKDAKFRPLQEIARRHFKKG